MITAPVVAVLGGGMAGLTAALRLREAGIRTVLLEAGERVGGPVGSERRDGWLLETGPTYLPPLPEAVGSLLERNGVRPDRIHPAGRQRRLIRTAGDLAVVPESTSELVSSPLLSLAGRMRLVREPFVERGGHPAETVREFGERRYGREMTRQFLEPAVAASTGGDPATLLAAPVIPQQVEAERTSGSILRGRMRAARDRRRAGIAAEPPWGLAGGMGQLPAGMAGALGEAVEPGSEVGSVVEAGGRFDVHISSGRIVTVDAVVVALPGLAAAGVVGSVTGLDGIAEAAARVPHLDAASIWLGFAPGAFPRLEGTGAIPGAGFDTPVISLGMHAAAIPGRTPAGAGMVTALLGGVRYGEVLRMSPSEMVEAVRDFLAPAGKWSADPEILGVRYWSGSLPQLDRSHLAVEAAIAAGRREVPAVAFCGAWLNGGSVGQVMAGGITAAEQVMSHLSGGER